MDRGDTEVPAPEKLLYVVTAYGLLPIGPTCV